MSWTKIGEAWAFFEKALASNTKECILWPFSLQPTGYARMKRHGKSMFVHRAICIAVHGPCPENHETAHSCGVRACINPKHVSWKTKLKNAQDKKRHGTDNSGQRNGRAKLTWEIVSQIRAARGKERQIDLAHKFGVSIGVVCKIQLNQIWKEPSRDENS